MADEQNKGPLVDAARSIGSTIGKVVATVSGGKKSDEPQSEHLYRAEYVGSGTFLISKPKRKSHKRRQSALKGTVRGARK